MPSALDDDVGSSPLPVSRLNHTACTLPVYASPGSVTRPGATLGPSRGSSGRQDSDLLGGYERFPILFPLSQALHGTLSALRLRVAEPRDLLRYAANGPDMDAADARSLPCWPYIADPNLSPSCLLSRLRHDARVRRCMLASLAHCTVSSHRMFEQTRTIPHVCGAPYQRDIADAEGVRMRCSFEQSRFHMSASRHHGQHSR